MSAPPSDRAKALVGQRVTVESNRKGKSGSGVVEDVRWSGSVIVHPDGTSHPGIEFYIKPDEGRRFWTVAMPDCSPDEVAS